jgi:hypothetical protein
MDPEEEQLKLERKRASQAALLLGGMALAAGALICLVYLLIFKPWKIPLPRTSSPADSRPANSP